jgi:hypothetical protein
VVFPLYGSFHAGCLFIDLQYLSKAVVDFKASPQDQQHVLKAHKEQMLKSLSSLVHAQPPAVPNPATDKHVPKAKTKKTEVHNTLKAMAG